MKFNFYKQQKMLFLSCCTVLFLLRFNAILAQPSGWTGITSIQVTENSGNPLSDYQLRLVINTQSLISGGNLLADGSDLRFGSDCQGSSLYNYWIESGLNTNATVVWVKIDQIPALGTKTIYMYYGNPIAIAASSIPGTFFGPHSSTDSVASGGPGGVGNSQRGFRFSPNEDVLVTHFGKNEPNGTPRYVTLFDFASQNIISQIVVNGAAGQYSYGNLNNPIWLTQNTNYLLELFQGSSDGYYYGTSSQIGEHLTYHDMRYCNSCTENTFPTSTLTNFHYGYPDLWYFTKNTVSPAPTYTLVPLVETCNGLDDDCNGLIDDGLVFTTYYIDADNDGYGSLTGIQTTCNGAPAGFVSSSNDCDDGNGSINPGSAETCNGIDDDCNGFTDDGLVFTTYYIDADNDGYGSLSGVQTTCNGAPAGYVVSSSDCDDGNGSINPGAAEACNATDDNCNGLTDDGITFTDFYLDTDGDSYGDPAVSISSCQVVVSGYVTDNTDCDDGNILINPGAIEICNGIDDNCDGVTDAGSILVAGPISGPASQCVPVVTGSATFSTTAVPGATSYIWTVPSSMNILSGQGSTSIFVSWSSFAAHDGISGNISVTPVDNCGPGQSSSISIDINYTAPVRPSSISGPVKLCPGENGIYSVLAVARANSYQWILPAGLTIVSGNGSNVIEVSADNLFTGGTISCSAQNVCGASPVRTRATSLNTPLSPSAISGLANGVCGTSNVSYSVSLIPNANTYLWTVPAGATIVSGQGTNTIWVDFDFAFGSGLITVAGTNGCGNGPVRSLTVKGAPGIAGPISGDISICNGQSNVKYEVATVTGAGNYTWTIPVGATLVSSQGFKEIFVNWGAQSASGQQVSVVTSNACGLSPARVLNGIVINPIHCIRLGDSWETALSIAPNPAHNLVIISFHGVEHENFSMQLTDISGRTILQKNGTCTEGMQKHDLDISPCSSGIYFIKVSTGNRERTEKLIIE